MLHCFHALGNDVDVLRSADFDDRGYQTALRWRRDNRLDDFAIDLQSSRFKSKQTDDAGMSGAEIIDLDFDAKLFDGWNNLIKDGLKFVEGDCFKQLETQATACQRKLGQLGKQVRLCQSTRRHVD